MKFTLRKKIILSAILPLLLLGASIIIIAATIVKGSIISKVEEKPLDRQKIQEMPGITVYIVKTGDTLWDIAKRFYTTVEEICGLNELETDEVQPGYPLLLVKKVEN